MKYHIVIPARMASQRLPGKPLAMVGGATLIEHVYRRASSAAAESAVVATDATEILETCHAFGATAIMTSAGHSSGSDRIAECADLMGWTDDTLIVNLQGDEPLMPAVCLDQAARLLHDHASASVASLYHAIDSSTEACDPNAVKVVTDADGMALFFSRSIIPFPRDFASAEEAARAGLGWKRHVGLYAYRAGALRAFSRMQPTPLESAEKLEQLRFLESGRQIIMAEACENIPAGVDTPDDLERVRGLLLNDG
mgnify:CR=1 FL=1